MLLKEQNIRMEEWFEEHADKSFAKFWLATISFTESSFFPIPTDPFMAIMLLTKKNSWWKLSIFVSFFSVLGGVFGYLIGFIFFETVGQKIVDFYNLKEQFIYISDLFKENAFWTILTAAFTPIPYKLFTITAGVSKISPVSFLVASIIGRTARFFIVGIIMKIFGRQIGKVIFRYFNLALLIIVLLIILYIVFHFLF
jgi:membrane protein YqaA with SNARE-associated domain